MIKLKMHAMYDHFPDHNPVQGEPFIDCYSDTYLKECTGPGRNIALLLEPRSMIEDAYKYAEQHADYFRYIFTHDSKLLKLPNARIFNWGDVWLTTDSEKTKDISLCTSPKNWCPLHNARLRTYEFYLDHRGVDLFYGDWNNPRLPSVNAADYLEHYKYSIIIENDIDDWWFTEKILNCFATKTVPIYVGSPMIGELFNPGGIIQVKDWHTIPDVVQWLEPEKDYEKRREAIEENFRRVEPWKVHWKERFFRDYGDLLEDMIYE